MSESAEHHAAPAPSAATATRAKRVPIDDITVANVGELERAAAALLAAVDDGDVAGLRTAWERIFVQCTTRGAAHDALHEFLGPVAAAVERVETTAGAERKGVVRALLGRLASFEAQFESASEPHPGTP